MTTIQSTVYLVGALMLAHCAEQPGVALRVDLKTDYQWQRHFTHVEVDVFVVLGDQSFRLVRETRQLGLSDSDYFQGVRVAELEGLAPGMYRVSVRLVHDAGAMGGAGGLPELVAERTSVVSVHADAALTSVITVRCAGIECPVPGEDPLLLTCSGGAV